MPRPVKRMFVSNTGIATSSNTIAASGSVSTKLTQGFPTGDTLIHSLNLRHSGNLNLTATTPGSIITRGGVNNIRGMWLSTPQHGVIVNGLDGLTLHNVNYIINRVREVNTDVSSAATGTPTFDYGVGLDFRDPHARRPNDTSLDMFRVSYMELIYNVGGATDYISGGTYTTETIQVLNLEIHADVDPGLVDAGDVPLFKPYLDILRIPVSQTTTGFQITLPYGGRIIKEYFIQQRNGSTLLELANTVIGANDTDRISMYVGGYGWLSRLEWLALQDANVRELRLPSNMPTGSAVIQFAQRDANGYLASEMLGLNSQSGAVPLTELNIDSTSATNGQIWVTTRCLMPIPVDAQRPQSAAPAAK